MLSERVYRRLLVIYPREHRREYGELMVQLFRDRMRRDGGGFRGLIVWMQMIFDLVGTAFKEHKEGINMTKRIWIGAALAILLLTGAVGVGTLLAQSKGEMVVSVLNDSQTFSGSGADGLAEVMRQAAEDGAITHQSVDEIVQALAESSGEILSSSNGEEAGHMMVSVWNDSKTFPGTGASGLAEVMLQAVEEGAITQETADQIVQAASGDVQVDMWSHVAISGTEDGLAEAMRQVVKEGVIAQETADVIIGGFYLQSPLNTQRYYTFSGVDGFAEAMRQAVEEGVIAQEMADQILRSFNSKNTGS